MMLTLESNVFSTVAMIGYILAVAFLIASVALFFFFDIPKVFAYLSGSKKKKGVTKIREKQEEERHTSLPDAPSIKFGVTQPIEGAALPPSVAISKSKELPKGYHKLEGEAETSALADSEGATDVLNAAPVDQAEAATDVLNAAPVADEGATEVLSAAPADPDATEVLSAAPVSNAAATEVLSTPNAGRFIIVKDVVLIHTDQVL